MGAAKKSYQCRCTARFQSADAQPACPVCGHVVGSEPNRYVCPCSARFRSSDPQPVCPVCGRQDVKPAQEARTPSSGAGAGAGAAAGSSAGPDSADGNPLDMLAQLENGTGEACDEQGIALLTESMEKARNRQPPPGPSMQMTYCLNCGMATPSNAPTCQSCGQPWNVPPVQAAPVVRAAPRRRKDESSGGGFSWGWGGGIGGTLMVIVAICAGLARCNRLANQMEDREQGRQQQQQQLQEQNAELRRGFNTRRELTEQPIRLPKIQAPPPPTYSPPPAPRSYTPPRYTAPPRYTPPRTPPPRSPS